MKKSAMKLVLGGAYQKTSGSCADTTVGQNPHTDYSEPGNDRCWYYEDGHVSC